VLLAKKLGAFYFPEQNSPLQAAAISAHKIQRGSGLKMAVIFLSLLLTINIFRLPTYSGRGKMEQ
jgi:hypothetical protein